MDTHICCLLEVATYRSLESEGFQTSEVAPPGLFSDHEDQSTSSKIDEVAKKDKHRESYSGDCMHVFSWVEIPNSTQFVL